jgi:hypothetical protein
MQGRATEMEPLVFQFGSDSPQPAAEPTTTSTHHTTICTMLTDLPQTTHLESNP